MKPVGCARLAAFFSIATSVGTIVVNMVLFFRFVEYTIALGYEPVDKAPTDAVAIINFYKFIYQLNAVFVLLSMVQLMSSVYLLAADSHQDAVYKGRKWLLVSLVLAWSPTLVAFGAFVIFVHMNGTDVIFLYDNLDLLLKLGVTSLIFILVHFVASFCMCNVVGNAKTADYKYLQSV